MNDRIAVIGLGYVGLSLATGLAHKYEVVGFDVDESRIADLERGHDRNGMIPSEAVAQKSIRYTAEPSDLSGPNFLIVAVPTPVTASNEPDLSPLLSACSTVGPALKPGDTVVFESTVYPGCTEEDCVPVLERYSGLKSGIDFFVGYSPERIDPGNATWTLESVVKLVAGMDQRTTDLMAEVYGSVVEAGVYQAESIRTAEAAKVIENVQRDLNIALMNELAVLFKRMGLDTQSVLDAAGTKWNFARFYPGLVGGHCIPVDPYYLVHKAQQLGFHTDLISAARRVNDRVAPFVASEAVKLLVGNGKQVPGASALVLGLAFKENVKDSRNSKVFDIVRELSSFGVDTWVHDPLVAADEFNDRTVQDPFGAEAVYDVVVLAVPHDEFTERGAEATLGLCSADGSSRLLVDIRGVFEREIAVRDDVTYWRL